MQLLDAAGLDILTDQNRKADDNNPKGYYEYDPVKKLMVDKTWLPKAKGKVVKVIAQLLPYLPSNYDYKVIFMRRDMGEVLKSQQIMLGKEKDVLICYTTSGTSKNIEAAAKKAKSLGIKVVLFTGENKEIPIKAYCDYIFHAPSLKTANIQEIHNIMGHEICMKVEEELYNFNED